MARRTRSTHLLTIITAVILAAGAVTVGLTLFDQSGGHTHEPRLDTSQGLLVSTRTDLRMCVEAGAATEEQRAAIGTRLTEAMDDVRRHPHWNSAFGRARYARSATFQWGCPAPRLPGSRDRAVFLAGPGLTTDPSPYRVWIYVLDEATADRMYGAQWHSETTSAELMGEDHNLFPVSTALLIRHSRLTDRTAVTAGLHAALGLSDPQKGHA